tara:strand:+ start:20101 stop:20796 length:696 start_codon:yes stop_codon:yes gene_type:complete
MNKYAIRLLQGFFLLASISGIVYYGVQWLIISFLIYVLLETFVGNATLHRYYGHRSFEMAVWKENILRWLAHHIGVGSVLGWSGHHRWHHKYSDTEKDLHSPTKQGIMHILFGVWSANIPRKMIKDLLKDKKLLWWHKNYFKYHLVIILLLIIISPWILVFVYALPNLFCLLSGYIIAILPHRTGEVRNDLLTEIVTFGEGAHQYHHDNPKEYRFSKFDITAFVIEKFLKI